MRNAMAGLAAALVAGLMAAGPAGAQTPFRAVAKVNEMVITAWDVEQRARILNATGQGADTPEALGNLALDSLVENRLMLQAGKKAGIEPSEEQISAGVAELGRRSGLSGEEFRARLNQAGVSDQAIDDMVGAQMVWRDVVRQRFQGRIEPGEAEIDAEIALAGEQRATALRLREIGLAYGDGGRSEAETRAFAASLVNQLRAGGSFAEAVRRYSRSQSRENGGDVGWVPLEGLPPELVPVLGRLEPGGIADPIPVQGGVSILQVVERRSQEAEIDADDPELRERVRQSIVTGRLESLAEGLLQELRRDALIQIR